MAELPSDSAHPPVVPKPPSAAPRSSVGSAFRRAVAGEVNSGVAAYEASDGAIATLVTADRVRDSMARLLQRRFKTYVIGKRFNQLLYTVWLRSQWDSLKLMMMYCDLSPPLELDTFSISELAVEISPSADDEPTPLPVHVDETVTALSVMHSLQVSRVHHHARVLTDKEVGIDLGWRSREAAAAAATAVGASSPRTRPGSGTSLASPRARPGRPSTARTARSSRSGSVSIPPPAAVGLSRYQSPVVDAVRGPFMSLGAFLVFVRDFELHEETMPLRYLFNVFRLALVHQEKRSAAHGAAMQMAQRFGGAPAPAQPTEPLWKKCLNRLGWEHALHQLADDYVYEVYGCPPSLGESSSSRGHPLTGKSRSKGVGVPIFHRRPSQDAARTGRSKLLAGLQKLQYEAPYIRPAKRVQLFLTRLVWLCGGSPSWAAHALGQDDLLYHDAVHAHGNWSPPVVLPTSSKDTRLHVVTDREFVQVLGDSRIAWLMIQMEPHAAAVFHKYSSSNPVLPFPRQRHWTEEFARTPEDIEAVGVVLPHDRDAVGRRRASNRGKPRRMSYTDFLKALSTEGLLAPHLLGESMLYVALMSLFLAAFPVLEPVEPQQPDADPESDDEAVAEAPVPEAVPTSPHPQPSSPVVTTSSSPPAASPTSVRSSPTAAGFHASAGAGAGTGAGGVAASPQGVAISSGVHAVRREPRSQCWTFGTMSFGLQARLRQQFRRMTQSKRGANSPRPPLFGTATLGFRDGAASTPGASPVPLTPEARPRLRLSHLPACLMAVGRTMSETEIMLVVYSRRLTLESFVDEDEYIDILRSLLHVRYRLLSLLLSPAGFYSILAVASAMGLVDLERRAVVPPTIMARLHHKIAALCELEASWLSREKKLLPRDSPPDADLPLVYRALDRLLLHLFSRLTLIADPTATKAAAQLPAAAFMVLVLDCGVFAGCDRTTVLGVLHARWEGKPFATQRLRFDDVRGLFFVLLKCSYVNCGGSPHQYENPRAETPARLLPPTDFVHHGDGSDVVSDADRVAFGAGVPPGLMRVLHSLFPEEVAAAADQLATATAADERDAAAALLRMNAPKKAAKRTSPLRTPRRCQRDGRSAARPTGGRHHTSTGATSLTSRRRRRRLGGSPVSAGRKSPPLPGAHARTGMSRSPPDPAAREALKEATRPSADASRLLPPRQLVPQFSFRRESRMKDLVNATRTAGVLPDAHSSPSRSPMKRRQRLLDAAAASDDTVPATVGDGISPHGCVARRAVHRLFTLYHLYGPAKLDALADRVFSAFPAAPRKPVTAHRSQPAPMAPAAVHAAKEHAVRVAAAVHEAEARRTARAAEREAAEARRAAQREAAGAAVVSDGADPATGTAGDGAPTVETSAATAWDARSEDNTRRRSPMAVSFAVRRRGKDGHGASATRRQRHGGGGGPSTASPPSRRGFPAGSGAHPPRSPIHPARPAGSPVHGGALVPLHNPGRAAGLVRVHAPGSPPALVLSPRNMRPRSGDDRLPSSRAFVPGNPLYTHGMRKLLRQTRRPRSRRQSLSPRALMATPGTSSPGHTLPSGGGGRGFSSARRPHPLSSSSPTAAAGLQMRLPGPRYRPQAGGYVSPPRGSPRSSPTSSRNASRCSSPSARGPASRPRPVQDSRVFLTAVPADDGLSGDDAGSHDAATPTSHSASPSPTSDTACHEGGGGDAPGGDAPQPGGDGGGGDAAGVSFAPGRRGSGVVLKDVQVTPATLDASLHTTDWVWRPPRRSVASTALVTTAGPVPPLNLAKVAAAGGSSAFARPVSERLSRPTQLSRYLDVKLQRLPAATAGVKPSPRLQEERARQPLQPQRPRPAARLVHPAAFTKVRQPARGELPYARQADVYYRRQVALLPDNFAIRHSYTQFLADKRTSLQQSSRVVVALDTEAAANPPPHRVATAGPLQPSELKASRSPHANTVIIDDLLSASAAELPDLPDLSHF